MPTIGEKNNQPIAERPNLGAATPAPTTNKNSASAPVTVEAEVHPLSGQPPPPSDHQQPQSIEQRDVGSAEAAGLPTIAEEVEEGGFQGSEWATKGLFETGQTTPWVSEKDHEGSLYGAMTGKPIDDAFVDRLVEGIQTMVDKEINTMSERIDALLEKHFGDLLTQEKAAEIRSIAESIDEDAASFIDDTDVAVKEVVYELSNIEDAHAFMVAAGTTAASIATESGIPPDELTRDLASATNYLLQVNQDSDQINRLVDKAMAGEASKEELGQLNSLLRSHTHNLNLVESWLSEKCMQVREDGRTSAEAKAEMEGILVSLTGRLTEKHVQLINVMSMCSDQLPENEPVSRAQLLHLNQIDAQSVLRAVKSIPGCAAKVPSEAVEDLVKNLEEHCGNLQKLSDLESGQEPAKMNKPLGSQLSSVQQWGTVTARSPGKKAGKNLRQELEQHWNAVNQGKSKEPLLSATTNPGISQIEYLNLFVKNQLKNAGVPDSEMPNMKVLVEESRAEVLNNNPDAWRPINRDVEFSCGGENCTVKSSITPSAHFLNDKITDPSPKRGISAGDRLTETKHVPNLALSELRNAAGERIFSGLRHGILDAYSINGKTLMSLPKEKLQAVLEDLQQSGGGKLEPFLKGGAVTDLMQAMSSNKKLASSVAKAVREQAADNMAKELVTAALFNNPSKYEAALRGEETSLVLDSISLVTPDPVRGMKKKSEKGMLKMQAEALKRMQGEQQLKVRDPESGQEKTVAVKVRVNPLNFGVNAGAVASIFGALNPISRIMRAISGWGFSMPMNNRGINQLIGNPNRRGIGGEAAEKINQLVERRNRLQATRNQAAGDEGAVSHQREIDELNKEINILTDLSNQVRDIWRSRSFSRGGHEPYKMVSRLALLSNKLGHELAFNCKSGKDRTGQLDAEVKYLAAVADLTGRVPEPNQAPTMETKNSKTNFALNTGNHEMQIYNVGVQGYKLNHVKGLKKQMEEAAWPVYRGGSNLIQS